MKEVIKMTTVQLVVGQRLFGLADSIWFHEDVLVPISRQDVHSPLVDLGRDATLSGVRVEEAGIALRVQEANGDALQFRPFKRKINHFKKTGKGSKNSNVFVT